MSFLKHISGTQRGAMFGLDARIALAIMAALGIVVGASMVQILKDRRVDNLLFEQEKFASAVGAYQEDLETNINSTLTTVNSTNAFMALVDRSLLQAQYQGKWLGPYLREYNSTNHNEYGSYGMLLRDEDLGATCTLAKRRNRECFHFLSITQVPLDTIEGVNEALDGTAEATPESEGKVRWDTITATNARLYMRLGLAAP